MSNSTDPVTQAQLVQDWFENHTPGHAFAQMRSFGGLTKYVQYELQQAIMADVDLPLAFVQTKIQSLVRAYVHQIEREADLLLQC